MLSRRLVPQLVKPISFGTMSKARLSSAAKLEGDERMNAIKQLEQRGWQEIKEKDAISKSYKFKNFVDCFGFMTKTALIAEKLNHHPEWFNVYNRLEVTLTTHDCQGLSGRDVKLANAMDSFMELYEKQ